MRKTIQILTAVLLGFSNLMAQVTISGTVTGSDGEPLIGVNIVEFSTNNGIVSDLNGSYSLIVTTADVKLVFSYSGYGTQSIEVAGRNTIDVLLEVGVELEEIVVTAFGISREKKSLTYAAQNADIDGMSEARPLNIVNGLSGNVAGISVIRSGNGVGSSSKVLLRGNRSVSGSSQPLYVVDGALMGEGIDNLSPDDIESIAVLKGANAAALYGSRANNGVIVVTTKMGRGKKGYAIDLNTSYMAASPIYLNKFQTKYGQGNDGIFNEHAERAWGPKLDGSQKPHWSNNPNWPAATTPYSANVNGKTSDFFQTGHNFATNLGISTRTDNSQSYFSYTYTDAEGIVPTNTLETHNLSLRMNTKLLNKLSLDTKVNYIRDKRSNILHSGHGEENPIRALYKMPSNIQTADVGVYEFTDNEGLNKQHFWQPGLSAEPANPYWALHNITNSGLNERVIALVSLTYDITDHLSILGRSSIDRRNHHRFDRYATDTYNIAEKGFYQTFDNRGFEWNSDFLLNYQRDFRPEISIDVSAGSNIRRNETGQIIGNPGRSGSPLNVPNLFSFGNTSNITAAESFSTKEVQSIYGFTTIGWKNAIYLEITGRNDWSSTLTKENRSFFYPSVGLTIVASDLFPSLPSWLSFLKVRGSYAEVGNDTDPFLSVRSLNVTAGGTGGFAQLGNTIPNENLRPEKTTSIEVGLDMRLFQNRLGLDLTYYKSNSTDQLYSINIPVASGASRVFLNGGDIQNRGIEAVINAGIIKSSNFNWDLTLNYAANDSEVKKIAEGFGKLDLVGGGHMGVMRLIEGRPWGDVYTRGFVRDEQGRAIIGSDGLPRLTRGLDIRAANFNPDFLAGVRNTLSWDDFNLSFLIDVREGGTVVSNTNAIMWADGQTEETLIGREGGLIFGQNFFPNETAVQQDGTPNNVATNAEEMWTRLGGLNSPIGEAFILDASNIRLREAVLGYTVPHSVLVNSPLSFLKVSLVGRNLFFISNKAGNFDPEVFPFTESRNAELQEDFGPPTSREYGINLKFGF